MGEKPEVKTDKRLKNLRPPFRKGERVPGAGRPPGQRNYATIYREALENIAKANGKTPEEIETMMEEVGLKQGMKGNFAFWKDIRDRIHGKPVQPITGEITHNAQLSDEQLQRIARRIADGRATGKKKSG